MTDSSSVLSESVIGETSTDRRIETCTSTVRAIRTPVNGDIVDDISFKRLGSPEADRATRPELIRLINERRPQTQNHLDFGDAKQDKSRVASKAALSCAAFA